MIKVLSQQPPVELVVADLEKCDSVVSNNFR